MAVDQHWRLYFDPQVIADKPLDESAGVVLHEISHLLLKHHGRAERLVPTESSSGNWQLWNRAADYAVNSFLRDQSIPLWDGMLCPVNDGFPPLLSAEDNFRRLTDQQSQEDQDDASAAPDGEGDQSAPAGNDAGDADGCRDEPSGGDRDAVPPSDGDSGMGDPGDGGHTSNADGSGSGDPGGDGACLEREGLAVVEAANGADALAKFDQFSPDIVLLDVVMPELDGFATCRELRSRGHGRRTPILMLTGLDDVESVDGAYEAGATDFLPKPVKDKVLLAAVEQALVRAERELGERAELASVQRRLASLTPRELEVMALVVRGFFKQANCF